MKDFVAQFLGFLWVCFVSLFGIVARQSYQGMQSGKMDWRVLWIAALAAPGLGIMADGLAAYWGFPLGAIRVGAIALTGFIGPSFVLAIAETIRERIIRRIP